MALFRWCVRLAMLVVLLIPAQVVIGLAMIAAHHGGLAWMAAAVLLGLMLSPLQVFCLRYWLDLSRRMRDVI